MGVAFVGRFWQIRIVVRLVPQSYEPLAEGDGAAVRGDARGLPDGGVGEIAGVAVAEPVFAGVTARAGMGTVSGTAGADVSGWMGMGMVLGAFCTGVALGAGDSSGGDSGALPQAETKAAKINTRTLFMMGSSPCWIITAFRVLLSTISTVTLIQPSFQANMQ